MNTKNARKATERDRRRFLKESAVLALLSQGAGGQARQGEFQKARGLLILDYFAEFKRKMHFS